MKDRKRYTWSFVLLTLLAVFFMLLNLSMGSLKAEPGRIWNMIAGRETDQIYRMIVLQIRLPRLLGAFILGGALSVSGFLLQTFFHNPLAGPFVLGISSGAKLMVAMAMTFSLGMGLVLNSWLMIGAAFFGSMLVMGFILIVSGKTRKSVSLIICGVMTGYFCSAITELVITFASDSNIVNLHSWSQGSFSGISWGNVGVMAPAVALCMAASLMISKPMGALQLGEEYAKSCGVNIKGLRAALIVLAGLLAAIVAAFAGPVSFVGIAVPQLMKGLLRSEKPVLMLPASFLGGAVFCLASDLFARLLFAPTELSISVVTSILGAPVVIWIMLKKQREREA